MAVLRLPTSFQGRNVSESQSAGIDERSLMKPDSTMRERHRLDPAKIIETADHLARRVSEKLLESTLAGLAAELAQVVRKTEERAREARRPILAIRIASILAVCGTLLGLWYLARHIHARWEFGMITEVFEATDAGFNLLVILAGLSGRSSRSRPGSSAGRPWGPSSNCATSSTSSTSRNCTTRPICTIPIPRIPSRP